MVRGDVLLWQAGYDWTSPLIAWGMDGPYCHASVGPGDSTNIGIGAHAEDGIRVRSVEDAEDVREPYALG